MSWSQGWGEAEGVPGSWTGEEWALGAHAEPCVRPRAPEGVCVCGGLDTAARWAQGRSGGGGCWAEPRGPRLPGQAGVTKAVEGGGMSS